MDASRQCAGRHSDHVHRSEIEPLSAAYAVLLARQCAMKHSNDVQLSANQERAEQARRYRSNPNKKRGI
jgi:hypothetical protein